MGLVSAAVAPRPAARATVGTSSGLITPEKWVEDWFAGGGSSRSGPWISEATALHYSPFFAGVNAIATDVGKLPLLLYERRQPRGKRRAREHPLYRVLHDEPNELMTPIAFKRTLQGHALTWGTGYAYIVSDGAGQVRELWPLRPDRITPDVRPVRGGSPGQVRVWWRYSDDVNGIHTLLSPRQVLTVGGLGFDGLHGYSVVSMARQAIALGMAAETFGAQLFFNGARPGGALVHPKVLSDEARKRIRADWERAHRGLDQAQRVAILEEGVEWKDIGIPPQDAQFLETRKFGVTDMARWLRIPPHKIFDLERATFSNIEQQDLEYVGDTLLGWLVSWDQACNQRLLTPPERQVLFCEHLLDAQLRAQLKDRYDAYAVGKQWGWLSGDDIAELENRNPLPDGVGETYWMPLNMGPAIGPDAEPMPERAGRCPVHPGCTCQPRSIDGP